MHVSLLQKRCHKEIKTKHHDELIFDVLPPNLTPILGTLLPLSERLSINMKDRNN